ncbi:hypothetical protein F5Y06DRAFT_294614 [Hypoxylon sp. FL0890]|nr:hypothetical protein F5Y06DRAFT_294614 [Hypoxylon sp. FL0890]
MSAAPRSPDQREPKSKQRSSSHLHPSTANKKHHHSTVRDTTHNTENPDRRPSATASGNQNKNNNTTTAAPAASAAPAPTSTYQNPGPGFDHIVTNVPGVGLVYDHQPVNGSNPAPGQQPHLQHQGPGLARPQVLPPGFVQASASPQFVSPVSHLSNPAMAYTTFMPNQGQHFQPPVPDTTYGEIPHTYTPRFDNPVTGGQYMTINGQIYRVVGNATAQDGAAGGAPVQFVPLQQVSTLQTQGSSSVLPALQAVPCYVAQQASAQPVHYLVNASLIRTFSEVAFERARSAACPHSDGQTDQSPTYHDLSSFPFLIATGAANNPVFLQQGTQQPVYVQAQAGPLGIAPPAPVATQPGAFPPMFGQPQVQAVGATSMPGAWPPSAAPDVMGIGKTGMEVQIEQFHTALNTKALEGQDIAPADPDVSRMYYCRELDGEWTLRNRYCIDNMGDCRWYVMPGGIFYAVRLAD